MKDPLIKCPICSLPNIECWTGLDCEDCIYDNRDGLNNPCFDSNNCEHTEHEIIIFLLGKMQDLMAERDGLLAELTHIENELEEDQIFFAKERTYGEKQSI
jgi:hypothetical protein